MHTPRLLAWGLAAALAVAGAPPLVAQDGDEDVEIVWPLKENLYADAPSSGAMIRGVQIRPGTRTRDLRIGLFYPDAGVTHLCVTAVSASGLYSAEGWFRRRSPPSGEMVFAGYASRERGYLEGLEAQGLGVVARAATPPYPPEPESEPADCPPIRFGVGESADDPLQVVLSGWRMAERKGAEWLDVFVNSLASDGARISPSHYGSDGAADCVPVEAERASAYNLVCSLPLALLGGDVAEIRIDFTTGGQLDHASWLTVRKPAGGR